MEQDSDVQPNSSAQAAITPSDMLLAAAETFKQRAEVYGDNYKKFGHVMLALFPPGRAPYLTNETDWNRLGLIVQIISKLTRYIENYSSGGHDDSLQDLSVYAAMLRSIDKDISEIPF